MHALLYRKLTEQRPLGLFDPAELEPFLVEAEELSAALIEIGFTGGEPFEPAHDRLGGALRFSAVIVS